MTVLWRLSKLDRVNALAVAMLTLLVAGYYAPRGFRGGFTDMAHDGYQLRQLVDLDRGGTIFKDTFDQYGPLSGYLNLAAFRLFGRTLLAVKYVICVWYAAVAVLLYMLARELLTPGWSMASIVIWLALAPFYGHGVMISPHAYVLLFQAVATLVIVRFAAQDRLQWLAVAGVCCGLCWALKTQMGVLFAIGASAYLATQFARGRSSAIRTIAALSTFLGSAACVAALTLLLLASRGALNDWYLQTIVFPKTFYVDQTSAAVGAFASLKKFAWRFFELNFATESVPVALYWHFTRVVVVCGAVVVWRRQRAPDLLLLSACLTTLWLGAFPSAYYMHQWWLTSLSIAPFVYCVHRAVAFALDTQWNGRLSRAHRS